VNNVNELSFQIPVFTGNDTLFDNEDEGIQLNGKTQHFSKLIKNPHID
jgi:hypothetical protein